MGAKARILTRSAGLTFRGRDARHCAATSPLYDSPALSWVSSGSWGITMEAVYYTITGVVLYLLADRLLRLLEARAGRVFEHRSLVFFVLLLSMALASFAVIRRLAPI